MNSTHDASVLKKKNSTQGGKKSLDNVSGEGDGLPWDGGTDYSTLSALVCVRPDGVLFPKSECSLGLAALCVGK